MSARFDDKRREGMRRARKRRVSKDKISFEFLRRLRKSQMRRHRQQRYGFILPNNDDGRRWLHELLLVEALNPKATDKLLMNTIETVAPWMNPVEATTVIEHINRIPPNERWRSPEELGKIFRVTNEERERLRLWTIQPCDMTSDELEKQRKEKAAARRQRDRQVRGAKPRADYLAANTANRTKPWIELGISRRTWYRRRGTSPSPLNLSYTDDTPVPPAKSRTPRKEPTVKKVHLSSKHRPSTKPEKPRTQANAPGGATARRCTRHGLVPPLSPVLGTDLSRRQTIGPEVNGHAYFGEPNGRTYDIAAALGASTGLTVKISREGEEKINAVYH